MNQRDLDQVETELRRLLMFELRPHQMLGLSADEQADRLERLHDLLTTLLDALGTPQTARTHEPLRFR